MDYKELLKHYADIRKRAEEPQVSPDSIYGVGKDGYYHRLFILWNNEFNSLDTTDYPCLEEMLDDFNQWLEDQLKTLEK